MSAPRGLYTGQSNIMLGKNVHSPGKAIKRNRHRTMTNRNGQTFLEICPIVTLEIPQVANREMPTGGVAIPIASAITPTQAKWTIFAPIARMIGVMMGTVSKMIEEVSINVPRIKKITKTSPYTT